MRPSVKEKKHISTTTHQNPLYRPGYKTNGFTALIVASNGTDRVLHRKGITNEGFFTAKGEGRPLSGGGIGVADGMSGGKAGAE
jgi:hypothetical protein